MSPQLVYGASFLAGVASRLLYFQRGEHHMLVTIYIRLFLAAIGATTFLIGSLADQALLPSFIQAATIGVSFLSGITCTLLIHRRFFHPLNKFAGPINARLSSLWLPYTLRNRDAFRQIRQLHAEYGQFVRLGPTLLSVTHPDAVPMIYGTKSRCSKASFYDLSLPMISLQTYRDKSLHDARRREWSGAFSDKALRGYEQRIQVYQQKLIEVFRETKGQPINVSKWFNYYNFDVMGDLAFAKPFNLLETHEHYAIKLLNEGLMPLGFFFPMWFFRTLTAIPGATRGWWKFISFCSEQMQNRLKESPEVPDITTTLVAPLKGRAPTPQEWDLLRGDAQLVVVAGSDTTATTLSALFLELAQNPSYISQLRDELVPCIDADGKILNEKTIHLNLLNAVINETLRKYPPVPTNLPRKTPPEGIVLGDTHIPGNVTVSCPQYVLGRDPEIYERPDDFVPERWFSSPEMIRKKGSFAPFSIGPFGCIGKPLAMMNLRTTVARLVMAFDFSFAPNEDGQNFEGQAKEQFTIAYGDLMISFKERF